MTASAQPEDVVIRQVMIAQLKVGNSGILRATLGSCVALGLIKLNTAATATYVSPHAG